jgi:molybdate transport system permease protein
MTWDPLLLTFKLAAITTFILLLVGIPIGYGIAYSRFRFKPAVEALISMPLVLPPTVLGFYFLLAFSPQNAFGNWLDQWLDLQLVFSFSGLVLASLIYSLPFMVQPLQSGFLGLPNSLREAAKLMGKSKWETLLRVLLPNMKASVLTGIVLSFAHTIGEFGVVLMIGGSIPGKTKVASIAIYEQVEAMNYEAANFYSGVLFTLTFLILLAVYALNGRFLNRRGL